NACEGSRFLRSATGLSKAGSANPAGAVGGGLGEASPLWGAAVRLADCATPRAPCEVGAQPTPDKRDAESRRVAVGQSLFFMRCSEFQAASNADLDARPVERVRREKQGLGVRG